MAQFSQIPIKFEPQTFYHREDFMVADCNRAALKAVESWPDWPFFALLLFGPKGCGKSHLAHIFAQTVCLKTKKPIPVGFVMAQDLTVKKIKTLHDEYSCLVVENLKADIDENALFHLFNLYQNEGGYLLLTALKPPAYFNFKLPDLASRLKIIPSVALLEPDDKMLSALIVKLFSDRQINISQETLDYMTSHMERSFSYAIKLVEEADAVSLSLKRAISSNIIKEAMHNLSLKKQPDLF